MQRSLFAGVTGLRSHQTMMDVVGNNIANVNTPGYKGSRATFQEALAQTIRGASGPTDELAGTNPMQVGLGSIVDDITGNFSQGALENTGRTGDLAIEGEGFFIVEGEEESFYTRDGSFSFDASGALTTGTGERVQGWGVDDDTGEVETTDPIDDIVIPAGLQTDPVATTEATIGGNLSAGAEDGDTASSSIEIYDSLGNASTITLLFERQAGGEWEVEAEIPGEPAPVALGTLEFDSSGQLDTGASSAVDGDGVLEITGITAPGADPQDVAIDLLSDSPVLGVGGSTDVDFRSQNGAQSGVLREIDFGSDGTITGRFSDGAPVVLGQVALATFDNPEGLVRNGGNLFSESINSGGALVDAPGVGAAGQLAPGTLEMSNVDLAEEFTNLIKAQRGFQANTRSITTTDEMLQELVNIKR